ncbi:MAG: hypothetical protein ACI836_000786, partial [Saprospiraceae bacterium]
MTFKPQGILSSGCAYSYRLKNSYVNSKQTKKPSAMQ